MLTDKGVKALKPSGTLYRRADAKGLGVPKSERMVALMESGGNLNVLLKGGLTEAKQKSPEAFNTTLRVGALSTLASFR